MTDLRVVGESLGGSPLATLAMSGDPRTAAWFTPVPVGADAWRSRAQAIGARFAGTEWLEALAPALGDKGPTLDRLRLVAKAGGVVVTSGQQPGLVGGPLYTLYKALTAHALAAEIERATGIPAAPLFWAATDDADYAEAMQVAVAGPDGATWLGDGAAEETGEVMMQRALPDVGASIETVINAAGVHADPAMTQTLRDAYGRGATVGGAYLAVLRASLARMDIAVLDAWHPALRTAAFAHLRLALRHAEPIASALQERDRAIIAAGFEPQVREVVGLSLVFRSVDGVKRRIPLADAARVARDVASDALSANVLMRPLLESLLVPTVGYVAGPGEISYFAQVGAVAEALGVPAPLAVPRWSGTIIEPHVGRMMATRGITLEELASPNTTEAIRARTLVDPRVLAALERLREAIDEELGNIASATPTEVPARSIEGARLLLRGRADRLERRIIAAAKRSDTELVRMLRAIRGAVRPGGKRQERALAWWPFVARHGEPLLVQLRREAAAHAKRLVADKHAGE